MSSLLTRAIEAVNVESLPLEGPLGWVILGIVVVAVPVGGLVLKLGIDRIRLGHRMLRSDPASTASVAQASGVVEVEGTARPLAGPTTGKFSDEPALVQSYKRERKDERTDDDGTTTTEWQTVTEGTDTVPFLVADDSGTVAVDPDGASLSMTRKRVDTDRSLTGRSDIREYEGRIGPGDDVYVYGARRSASEEADQLEGESVYIGAGDAVERFVISDGSEFRTAMRTIGWGLFLGLVGVVWIPLTIIVLLAILQARFGIQIT